MCVWKTHPIAITRYFVTFTDDYSRATMVYCIERKSEASDKFEEFATMSEALHSCKIAKLRVDNGGEYTRKEWQNSCVKRGIKLDYTVAFNPEMNSVSERVNRTLMDKARTMLLASGLEKKFWPEAVLAANFIKNRCPTSAVGDQFVDKTPAEIWFKNKPNLSILRVFGATCFNHIPKEKRSKLDERSSKCIMVGYASTRAYRLWNTETNKLIIGRNVVFNENAVLGRHNVSEIWDSEAEESLSNDGEAATDCDDVFGDSANDHGVDLDGTGCSKDIVHDVSLDGIGISKDNINGTDLDSIGNSTENGHDANMDGIGDNMLRRSTRNRRQPDRYGVNQTENDAHFALSAMEFVEDDPLSISEAKQRSDWKEWQKAINEEYDSLKKNNTWTECVLPVGRKAISCKWVFKLKRKSDGDIDKYKARLVAMGFSQTQGFDYNETYAPVAKLTTLRILLSIAAQMDLKVHQMDVKGAFLNGDLSEEIFMELPEGFKKGNTVCKLNKSLYGLKQASFSWNQKFNQFMLGIGFKRCMKDRCLYVKDGIKCYVLLYVDDLLISCTDQQIIDNIKGLLHKEFDMTNIGKVKTYLGVHIEHDEKNGTITLSQKRYFEDVLRKFGMSDCRAATTLMEKGLNLKKGDANKLPNIPYRELIGCLTYAMITTRPDICAAVNYFSRFQSCYTEEHFTHAKRILRYIKGTLDMKLVYRKYETADLQIGFVDADHGNDLNDRKSISGFVFKVFGNTVSWASRKQENVTISSTEAEYVSLANGICEANWMAILLGEIGFDREKPVTIFEDNKSAKVFAEGPGETKRMKHIDLKYHFVHDEIDAGKIELQFKPSTEQLADIMTKGLGRNLFDKHRKSLDLLC